MADSGGELTGLLDDWSRGDQEALGRLMPLVVDDLRKIAQKHFAREPRGHTLQPTALVNEAYLRLAGRRTVRWQSRAQFIGFLAGLMRCILVDHARRRKTAKRGADVPRVQLDEAMGVATDFEPDLLAVEEALRRLQDLDARQAQIVELRFFAGLKMGEIAEVLAVSSKTVRRDWHTAKLWLARELRPA